MTSFQFISGGTPLLFRRNSDHPVSTAARHSTPKLVKAEIASPGSEDAQKQAHLRSAPRTSTRVRRTCSSSPAGRSVWGSDFGMITGRKRRRDLVPFISDRDENVAYHAIAAFGSDTPRPVIERLVAISRVNRPELWRRRRHCHTTAPCAAVLRPFALWSYLRIINAHAMRAILFAKAAVTGLTGRRCRTALAN